MNHAHTSRRAACRAAATLLLLLLGACGKDSPRTATQVAATVNHDEISVHQVQHALQGQPRLVAAQPEVAARRVLDALVEQELAAQAARGAGLATDPQIVQAFEAAKRELLARAYQDRLASQAVSASADEIDRYYDSKPALFSARRLYAMQEFAIDVPGMDRARVEAAIAKAKTVEAISEGLHRAGLRFRTRQIAQAAEDLPMGVLEAVGKLADGESALITQPGGAQIYIVLHAEPAAVNRHLAKGPIAAYLLGERKRDLVNEGMKSLRDQARIVYQGSFAAQAGEPVGTSPAAEFAAASTATVR